MKVSRLPFGPGQPGRREPLHREADPRAASATAEHRLAPLGGRADDPAANPSLAELELRLDQGDDLAAGREASRDRREAPWRAR